MFNEQVNTGKFVISLDFELIWGVRDKRTIEDYGKSIASVHTILPKMLNTFDEYDVKATFATVGFLFAENKKELIKYSPKQKPQYNDVNLSPYNDNFAHAKDEPIDDPYHYGMDLINLIKKGERHEIACHTFSHFYCHEKGQSVDEFKSDLEAAIAIAKSKNISFDSIVFPRNQVRRTYIDVCKEYGIKTFRGNEKIWFCNPESEEDTTLLKRVFRTLDCYLNISGHHSYHLKNLAGKESYNIPSSRFLRPYLDNSMGDVLEWLKVYRIKKSMTYAAKNKMMYHLWWHPHNYGTNTERNFSTLIKILDHYKYLNKNYGFESSTMSEYGYLLEAVKYSNKELALQ